MSSARACLSNSAAMFQGSCRATGCDVRPAAAAAAAATTLQPSLSTCSPPAPSSSLPCQSCSSPTSRSTPAVPPFAATHSHRHPRWSSHPCQHQRQLSSQPQQQSQQRHLLPAQAAGQQRQQECSPSSCTCRGALGRAVGCSSHSQTHSPQARSSSGSASSRQTRHGHTKPSACLGASAQLTLHRRLGS